MANTNEEKRALTLKNTLKGNKRIYKTAARLADVEKAKQAKLRSTPMVTHDRLLQDYNEHSMILEDLRSRGSLGHEPNLIIGDEVFIRPHMHYWIGLSPDVTNCKLKILKRLMGGFILQFLEGPEIGKCPGPFAQESLRKAP